MGGYRVSLFVDILRGFGSRPMQALQGGGVRKRHSLLPLALPGQEGLERVSYTFDTSAQDLWRYDMG